MRDVYITACGAALPNSPVDNESMERIIGYVGGRPSPLRTRILNSNGITSRHYAIDPVTREFTHSNAELTAEAIRNLEQDGVDIDTMQALACGTSTPDQLMPGHALMTQGLLGVSDIPAVTTTGLCLAGLTAWEFAWLSVASGRYDNAVASASEIYSAVMAAETFSREAEHTTIDPEIGLAIAFERDFLRWMLSDGAGAIWLSAEPRTDELSLRIDWLETISYAGEMPLCMHRGLKVNEDGSTTGWPQLPFDTALNDGVFSLQQNVRLLNKNIVYYTLEKPLAKLMVKHGLSADKIDYVLPHYSSMYFHERSVAGLKRIGLDVDERKWFTNLTYKGNTGSASILLMLEELYHSGRLKEGDRIVCAVPESGRFSTGFAHLTVV
ncbi:MULTISPECIES: beta-ketoacyl-ACP synthase III [Mycobacterium]|uniref:Beta-ketoacyl-[acyl-carrier-protein] synthase III C-terminal domain-containing protein n=1 Tax=Mycobacterium kiyosense TaxID=2871094 RepID=A0A9P3UZF3_9MYCO|nr:MULTISPECIES: beta-ketoacyl-ACP synthase III [Mycobacterium]BDB45674.1 hypothetical protein IWGMT90018_61200 [Mycobacterium kiyosense]BDE11289.1 hypothetical protein MKCMC460_01490 [Mycobacterium sp. 20KCMC460]GLB84583.1 hypothetical protein SRL2020028_38390 [Mycobacterium kiyosense]GLB91617.1 hypothetical protein SRL2020130_44340 [Mycobacterium kiyosense]GLB96895.1 hypothetical protein SRL2020226_36710 [Mycobacterium kiyosense]